MKKEKAEITIRNLMAKIRHYYPQYVEEITAAYEFADEAHKGQKRESGRPYITHPVVVADILIDLGMEMPVICAALLHDTVEDTYATDEIVRERFGDEVADLIKGVTKLKRINSQSREDEQAENIRRMFIAMTKDIRVLIIKLADRLHNMRSLEFKAVEKQVLMAKETLDIYAPLAGRMGISAIKCELEDLSLKFFDRETYDYLVRQIKTTREERQAVVDQVILELDEILKENDIKGEVSGRNKHFYSIFKKMKNQGKSIEEIYDLTAVRVIVNTQQDCYNVFSIIHQVWRPIVGRFKDYISQPKPNNYQSIHTTVIIPQGMPIEIQIRTRDMHRVAEYGVAAHWKYKEDGRNAQSEGSSGDKSKNLKGKNASIAVSDSENAKNGLSESLKDSLKWVQEMVVYGDLLSSNEYLDAIKLDLAITNFVFVFTPKGDVISLIADATVLDFAYAIHSEVGNKCVGAKINNKIVHLNKTMETGDVIEIMTNPNSKGPSRDWLKVVKTASARFKIRQFFKREMRDENIKKGRSMLEFEASNMGHTLSVLMTENALKQVFERYSFTSLDEMYSSIGYGGIGIRQILLKLINVNREMNKEALIAKGKEEGKEKRNAVIVKGMADLLIRFSRCCDPVPGDSIIGYVSRGRGVTVHRQDCPSVKTLETARLIKAEWDIEGTNAVYTASICIISEDKGEVFAEITKTVAAEKLPLVAINARKDKNHNAITTISVEIHNQNELEALIKRLRALHNTLDIFRTPHN